MQPIMQIEFNAAELARDFPPRFHNRNKEIVWEIAGSSGFPFEGHIVASRWAEEPLPEEMTAQSKFMIRPGVFDYAPSSNPSEMAWYMNFADPYLFVAYDSWLMAQDELQVAEHPALGSLREALSSVGDSPRTVDSRGRPTPFTVTGVQRRCEIDTRPNPAAGRPSGLYGNAFALASESQVRSATKSLVPPTVSNILAIAAPSGGRGTYTLDDVSEILSAAFTGFSAARVETERMSAKEARTIIHTGFWGCGAFGGNRELMTIVQSLAADLADVDVSFWAFNADGMNTAARARGTYESLRTAAGPRVCAILEKIIRLKLPWGVSDGN